MFIGTSFPLSLNRHAAISRTPEQGLPSAADQRPLLPMSEELISDEGDTDNGHQQQRNLSRQRE
jgi:hypothetical protein